jgi:hypothetical protein
MAVMGSAENEAHFDAKLNMHPLKAGAISSKPKDLGLLDGSIFF